MPGSCIIGKEEISNWFDKQGSIKTIIDVGCGSGTYRKLLKKDYYWVGVEIWVPYIELFNLDSLYNEIIIADIAYFDFSYLLNRFKKEETCVILGDVIEHLDKADGLRVLNNVLNETGHFVLSLPVDGRDSEIHYGNLFESHKSKWAFKEVVSLCRWEKTIESRGMGIFIK
jgi:SAM-dependent methyltransferase